MVTVKSSPKRSRTVSAKVTCDEHRTLLDRARASGCSPSDFYRQILLNHEPPDSIRLQAAELRCIRSILLEVVARAVGNEPLSADVMAAIINDADAKKYSRAEQSIEQLKQAKGQAA